MNIKIAGDTKYTSGKAYAFGPMRPKIYAKPDLANITDNSFVYSVPAQTAFHLVLSAQK
jgi:hypothetical protein